MKTAVSVPDDVFQKAEQLAEREGRTRSDVYSAALREYVARRSPDEVTDAINRSLARLSDDATPDLFARRAAKRTLERSEW
jgi:predicted transcriptional regulator